MHFDLQVNLLTEQRTAKLIQLVEELRRALPNVRNRTDAEVELLRQRTETLEVRMGAPSSLPRGCRARARRVVAAEAGRADAARPVGKPAPRIAPR